MYFMVFKLSFIRILLQIPAVKKCESQLSSDGEFDGFHFIVSTAGDV